MTLIVSGAGAGRRGRRRVPGSIATACASRAEPPQRSARRSPARRDAPRRRDSRQPTRSAAGASQIYKAEAPTATTAAARRLRPAAGAAAGAAPSPPARRRAVGPPRLRARAGQAARRRPSPPPRRRRAAAKPVKPPSRRSPTPAKPAKLAGGRQAGEPKVETAAAAPTPPTPAAGQAAGADRRLLVRGPGRQGLARRRRPGGGRRGRQGQRVEPVAQGRQDRSTAPPSPASPPRPRAKAFCDELKAAGQDLLRQDDARGLADPRLRRARSSTAEERAFFRDVRPWGFILFARNVETPDQVRALVGRPARRRSAAEDAPVLIDQEGGRVQRLGPPHWPTLSARPRLRRPRANDPLMRREVARLGARLMAHDLAALGINVDCVPVLDVPDPGGHDIIGDRAYRRDAGRGGPARPRRRRGPDRRRRPAGDQAHPRPRPRHAPTATWSCRWSTRPRTTLDALGFRAVPRAVRHADGDDRARGLRGDRPDAPGHHLRAR